MADKPQKTLGCPADLPEAEIAGARPKTHGQPPVADLPASSDTTDAIEQAVRLDDAVSRLPNDLKLMAVLGITQDIEAKKLPEPYRAFTIKIPRRNLGAARAMLKDLALPCSSEFIGDPNDPEATLTYIAPHADNIQHILSESKRGALQAKIAVAENATLILRAKGSPIISIHSFLNDDVFAEAKSVSTDGASAAVYPARPGEMPELMQFDSANANAASYVAARKETMAIPRPGPCTYLMIDQNLFTDQSPDNPNLRKIIDEIGIFIASPTFHVTAYNGYLVLVDTAVKGESSLTAIAKRLYTAVPSARIFVGNGVVRRDFPGQFAIDGLPHTNTRQKFTEQEAGVYLKPACHQALTDPTKRASSLCVVKIREVEDFDWLRLAEFRPKVSLRVGGPDRLIGYEKELSDVENFLSGNAKLMTLKGMAGMGKSRLLETALQGFPSTVVCSLDPSGVNIPGFGLMTVAEQITAALKDNPDLYVRHAQEISGLLKYDRKSQKEKITTAQQSPAKLVDICLRALAILNMGKTALVIDDMHYADRFSTPHLTALVSRYISETNGKAILSMRPEEMTEPQAVKRLRNSTTALYGQDCVKETILEGLDFTDNKTAHDFAYYSLPEALREGRVIGPWYQELGRIAGNSPFVMKTLMDFILEKPKETLIVTEEAVTLKQDVMDRLSEIRTDSDLSKHYLERIERLPEPSRKILQCMALMGGSANLGQISAVARYVLGSAATQDEFNAAVGPLLQGRYLIELPASDEDPASAKFQLQHETIKDIAVSSIKTPEEKLAMARGLYAEFRGDRTMHPDAKFALAHNIAADADAPEAGNPFWRDYTVIAKTCLEEAKRQNASRRVHSIGKMICETPVAEKALNALQSQCLAPDEIGRLAVDSLFAMAEHAIFIGKFDEVGKAVDRLKQICEKNPDAANAANAHQLVFEQAYIQARAGKMQEVFDRDLKGGASVPAPVALINQIKIAYRKGLFDEVDRLFREGRAALEDLNRAYKKTSRGKPYPPFVEAQRLVFVRCPFERIREAARKPQEGKFFDDDVLMRPEALNREHRSAMETIAATELEYMKITQKRFPLAFNPYAELAIKEQEAHMQAFFGRYQRAEELFAESWQQAEQIGFYAAAARNAKLLGDMQIMEAVRGRRMIDRNLVVKAIKTYGEAGMVSLANIDEKDFYQMAMRIQRIRAVAILCTSYRHEIEAPAQDPVRLAQIKQELVPHIKKAMEDFGYLNTRWTDAAADPEVNYYLGHIGHVLGASNALGIALPENIFDEGQNPFMSYRSMGLGEAYAEKMVDAGIGEIEWKKAGCAKLRALKNAFEFSRAPTVPA